MPWYIACWAPRVKRSDTREAYKMLALTGAHAVAISTLVFCGICALTLINMLRHFDPPEARQLLEQPQYKVAV